MTNLSPNTIAMPENTADSSSVNEFIFISRQPIFDASEKIFGYQLLFLEDPSTQESPANTLRSSARLIANAYNNFGIRQVLSNKLAFIPISNDALVSDFLDLLPPDNIVLEIYPSNIRITELLATLTSLKEKKYRFSLHNVSFSPELLPLFKMASFASYDIQNNSLETIAREIRQIQHLPIQCIARNIQGYQEFKEFHEKEPLFNLFQSSNLAPPETQSMKRMDPSTMRIMQLFNLVMSEAEFNVIEESFKHDVALCYSLLCYLNSAGFGMPYKVESIRSALMMMGYDFLWRWLSLLIFAGTDIHAGQRVLLNTALIRGRMMELAGQHFLSKKDGDRLFITGVFSMIDALVGIPLEQALANLNLPEVVTQALLANQGAYAPYLSLVLCFEKNDIQTAKTLCNTLKINLNEVTAHHLAAIEWARKLS